MCSQAPQEESYAFFENILDYIKKAKSTESDAERANSENKCSSFMNAYGHYFNVQDRAKEICKHYIKLYYSLKNDLNCISNNASNYKECSKFLKYWVNTKLKESMKNDDQCVHRIYNGLESQITGTDGFDIYLEFKDDINKDDLYKMNILYRLYKKYTDIDGILENSADGVKRTLLSLSTACCTDYLEANYMCNGGNDNNNNNHSQFCAQLGKFRTKYDLLYNREMGKNHEYTNYFKNLSECKNTNVTSTALIGTTVGLIPLMLGLYKFTPLRQLMNFIKGKLTQEYRNNEDEMRNIMLMDQGSEHISSQQGTYNIKYHSV